MSEQRYISVVDTAKLVRAALKKHWPGIKFSVRSSSYSMGASISVRWIDGPSPNNVDAVVGEFDGSTFDGMTDSKSYHTSDLNGELVHYGADSVRGSREVSDYAAKKALAEEFIELTCLCHGDFQSTRRFGGEHVEHLARSMIYTQDYCKGDMLQDTFRRVVLREEEGA